MTDLASRSQSYPTVTLSRQQSSGLLATTESKREAERQQVIMETKRGEKKEMRVMKEGKWKTRGGNSAENRWAL